MNNSGKKSNNIRISFSMSSRQKSQVKSSGIFGGDNTASESRDFITGIGEGGLESTNPTVQDDTPLIISPLNNRWRASDGAKGGEHRDMEVDSGESQVPITPGDAQTLAEEAALRKDLEGLPDEANLDAYDKIPIAEFGMALLRGMGWTPGAPVGRNATTAVKPVEFIPRHHRLGLGAVPKAQTPETRKKFIKPGETREVQDLVLPPDADGRQRSVKTLDEKLVPRAMILGGPREGAEVEIQGGKHEGMRGRIVKVDGDKAVILLKSKAEVIVSRSILSQLQYSGITNTNKREEHGKSKRSREYSESTRDKKKHQLDKKNEKERKEKERRPWVTPQIRVRVISKSFHDGKYYQQKGTIIDVPFGSVCTVSFGNTVIDDVKQKYIETALPKPGGNVKIVAGPDRNRIGTLRERNSKKDQAIVQLADDLSIHTYSFDDVGEYCGEIE